MIDKFKLDDYKTTEDVMDTYSSILEAIMDKINDMVDAIRDIRSTADSSICRGSVNINGD